MRVAEGSNRLLTAVGTQRGRRDGLAEFPAQRSRAVEGELRISVEVRLPSGPGLVQRSLVPRELDLLDAENRYSMSLVVFWVRERRARRLDRY